MHRHKYTDIQQELICNVSTTEENICLLEIGKKKKKRTKTEFDSFVLVDTDFSSFKTKQNKKKGNNNNKKQLSNQLANVSNTTRSSVKPIQLVTAIILLDLI